MDNTIQINYAANTYSGICRETDNAAARGESFFDVAARISKSAAALQSSDAAPARTAFASGISAYMMCETSGENALSPEEILKAKYPNLHYHVFDASSGYWRTRNDYPHYLLYQDGDKAKEVLENWEPSGANPFYGSKDGRFIAPKAIHALSSIPPGQTAVVIHPKVQERMEQDPDYAREIIAKIDAWFAFDKARNEAMMPGITARSSWSVAIGEDGEIVNAQSFSHGEMTFSKSGDDSAVKIYNLRRKKHAEFMRWLAEKQIEDKIKKSELAASEAEDVRLKRIFESGQFGKTVLY